jgi:hypothetical protein
MKAVFSQLLLLTLTVTAFAQSDKYVTAMTPKIAMLDTARNGATLLGLSNSFERIANTEKNQWLPYYYAALAQVNYGMTMLDHTGMGGDPNVIDPVADKAETLSPNNSEIFIIHKLIDRMRMLVDPQNRYMSYGMQANQALATAQKLNPENPRVYLLQAEDKYFTPEQYGGSKDEAKKLFDTAQEKYTSFKPENALAPNWGKYALEYFLAQYK